MVNNQKNKVAVEEEKPLQYHLQKKGNALKPTSSTDFLGAVNKRAMLSKYISLEIQHEVECLIYIFRLILVFQNNYSTFYNVTGSP